MVKAYGSIVIRAPQCGRGTHGRTEAPADRWFDVCRVAAETLGRRLGTEGGGHRLLGDGTGRLGHDSTAAYGASASAPAHVRREGRGASGSPPAQTHWGLHWGI